MNRCFLTSESVTIGHPDKMCDYISDSILDKILIQDKNARVACETVAYKNNILVTGEITTSANINIENIVRDCIKEIGYNDETVGMNYKNCNVNINVSKQSLDIALGVNVGGAGDQGIMIGYATNETKEYMPWPIVFANNLAKRLEYVRKNNIINKLGPDGKTQITAEYENNILKRIDSIVISTQHDSDSNLEKLKLEIIDKVIVNVVNNKLLDEKTKIYINPTGRFVIGGPLGDVGLTGRKLMVDTYGTFARHGGGAFSGKDPSKVDRSGAYMARYIAKNIVANNLADKCEIELSYVIGKKKVNSISINCFETEKVNIEEFEAIIRKNFNMTPNGIISTFNLLRPIYKDFSSYGHMGRIDLNPPWEKIIKLKV